MPAGRVPPGPSPGPGLDRAPAPHERAGIASDARIDSTGHLLGSFVGEGTPRRCHLVSSDTGLIAELVRRASPAAPRGHDLRAWLARERVLTIRLDGPAAGPIRLGRLPAASAGGRGELAVDSIVLRGSRCEGRATPSWRPRCCSGRGPGARA